MKSLEKQIEFLDATFLPAYGIASINDTRTRVSAETLTDEQLKCVDSLVERLRECYPVKSFSLHKTDYHIVKSEQAISVLKKCLVISNVPFTVNSANAVRLSEENSILRTFRNKSSEYRTNTSIKKMSHDVSQPIIPGTGLSLDGNVLSVDSSLRHVNTLGILMGLQSAGPVNITCTAPDVAPNHGALRVAGDASMERRLSVKGDIFSRGRRVLVEDDLADILSRIVKLEDALDS